MRTLSGVRLENRKIIIQTHLLNLPDLSGTAITPLGHVQYQYRKDQSNGWWYEIILPEQAEGCLILSEGRQILFTGKLFYTT